MSSSTLCLYEWWVRTIVYCYSYITSTYLWNILQDDYTALGVLYENSNTQICIPKFCLSIVKKEKQDLMRVKQRNQVICPSQNMFEAVLGLWRKLEFQQKAIMLQQIKWQILTLGTVQVRFESRQREVLWFINLHLENIVPKTIYICMWEIWIHYTHFSEKINCLKFCQKMLISPWNVYYFSTFCTFFKTSCLVSCYLHFIVQK